MRQIRKILMEGTDTSSGTKRFSMLSDQMDSTRHSGTVTKEDIQMIANRKRYHNATVYVNSGDNDRVVRCE